MKGYLLKKTLLTLVLTITVHCSIAQTFNPTPSINTAGSANTLVGGYTFAYATSGSPWNGAFMSFGGFSYNNYDCQISTDYGPHGGNRISFRTHNGDIAAWNSWNELYHSNNINKTDVDFNAKTIYSTNVHNVGNLWSKQIIVALTNPWPDYVFANTYDLLTLPETEQHIKEKGHLPGIPSAAEVTADGIDLGKINVKLLQKIEELTLYLIEMNKKTEQQQHDIDYLKSKLK